MSVPDGAILLLGEAGSGKRDALDRIEAEPPRGYETLRASATAGAVREDLEERFRVALGASASDDLDALIASPAMVRRWLVLLDASEGLQPELARTAARWIERSEGRIRFVAAVAPGAAFETALETLAPTGPPIRLSISGPDAAAAKVRRLLGVSAGQSVGRAIVTTAELTRARRSSDPLSGRPLAPTRTAGPVLEPETPTPLETDPRPPPAGTHPQPVPPLREPQAPGSEPSPPPSEQARAVRRLGEPSVSMLSWTRERVEARHALGLAAVIVLVLGFFGWTSANRSSVRAPDASVATTPALPEPGPRATPAPASEATPEPIPDTEVADTESDPRADLAALEPATADEAEEEPEGASDEPVAGLEAELAPVSAAPPQPEPAPVSAASPQPELAAVSAASPQPELAAVSAASPQPEPAVVSAASPVPDPEPDAAREPAGSEALEPDERLPPIIRDPARVPEIVRIGPPRLRVSRADGATRELALAPSPEPAQGLASAPELPRPEGSPLDVGGVPVAESTAGDPVPTDEMTTPEVLAGIVDVRVTPEGPDSIDVAAAADGGRQRRPEILRIGTPETISVAIDAAPAAQIVIDGAAAGTTPLSGVPLLPGVHQVRIEFADGGVAEESVRVERQRRRFLFRRVP